MKQTKLYIKQHKTGLQYFGKTVQNLEKYKGSGTYWTRHLDKYGDDVNTICIGIYNEDDPMLMEHALGFSACNDIVNSKEWANLVTENGLGGGCVIGLKHSKERRMNISKSLMGEKHPHFGKHFTEEHKRKISESNKGQKRSEEAKKKMSKGQKGIKKKIVICPYCGKEGGGGAMYQNHFNFCKSNPNRKMKPLEIERAKLKDKYLKIKKEYNFSSVRKLHIHIVENENYKQGEDALRVLLL